MSVTSASIGSISTDSGSSSTDFTTNDTTLTFAGVYTSNNTGGANLYLWIDGTLIGTISASANRTNAAWTYTYGTALAEGSHSVVVNTSNTNVGSGVRDTQAVVIDTTVAAPTVALATDSGASAVDNITKVGTLSVSGTESGATVEYSANGTSGWSTSAPALTQGSNTVYVRQTDVAGNVSTATSFTFTYDNVAPTTTIASAAFSADTGSSSSDLITKTASQTVSGTLSASLAAGETVQVSLDNGTTWQSATATVGQSTWSLSGVTLTTSSTLRVKVTDTAGNDGTVYSNTYTYDTTAAAPTVALATDSGSSSSDKITNVGTLTVSGTEASATVEYSADGTNWASSAPALTQGSNTVYVRQTDLAGNVSASTTFTFTYDSVAPSSLSASTLVLATASDSGVSSSDEITNVTTPTVTTSSLNGIAMSAGDVIQVVDTSNSNAVAGTYVVQVADLSGGAWSGTTKSITLSTLAAGDHALALRLVDSAGNVGTAGPSNTITIDTAAPTLSSSFPAAAATSVSTNNSIVLTFSEAVYAGGGTVTVQQGGTNTFVMTLTAGATSGAFSTGSGTWTIAGNKLIIDPSGNLTNSRTYDVDITNTALKDAAGNAYAGVTSFNGSNIYFTTGTTTDTTAPGTTVSTLAFSADTGSSGTDFITRTAAQTISGTLSTNLAAGETVQVSLDGGTTWKYADQSAVGSSTFSLSSATLTGSNTLSARVVDAAGNGGTAKTQSYVLDTTAPSAPSITSVTDDAGSVTGALSSGARTDDTNLTVKVSLTGTNAVAGDQIQLFNATTAQGTAYTLTAGDITNGFANVATGVLSDGTTYALNAKVIDVAGNASSASSSFSVTADTTAPSAPSITSVTDDVGSITGALSSGARTDDTNLTVKVSLTGTNALAGDQVQLFNSTTAQGAAYTLTAGDITNGFANVATGVLSNGTSYALNAKVTDAAGNTSSASGSFNVTVDTTAPSAPSITSVTDDVGSVTGALSSGARTDDTNLTVKVSLTGTNAVAGDQVQLFDATTAQGSAYTLTAGDITNGFANVATGVLSDGAYALNAKVIDVAGNASSASSSFNVTVDTTAPSVSGAVTGSATEDAATSTLDALASSTPIGGETLSMTNVPGTLPAGVTYDAGTHSFTLDPSNAAYQHLADGATTTVTVNYKVSDGLFTTPASVSWTVTGTNDAPSVSGAVTAEVTDHGAPSTLDGLANASAVDDGDTLSVTDVPATLPAGVTFDLATHSFSLDPSDAAYQHLAPGDSATVTVDYMVSDGTSNTPASIVWTVEGADDAPYVSGTVTGSVTEDGATSTLDALANASAVDDGDTLSVTGVPGTLPAGVTYDAGTHSFTLDPSNAAYQHLADGATTTVTVDYTVTDGLLSTPASASWTVTGTDDAPYVSGAVTGSATDHGAVSTLDALANASAVDDGDTLSVTGVPATLPAGVTYDAGTHSFSLDPSDAAYQHLAPGDSTTVQVDYAVSDGSSDTPASVSWTVEGADDAPYVSAAVTGSATEDGAVSTLDALANASAVDDGDTLSVTNVPATLPAGVTYDAGTHSFTLDPSNAAYQHLADGATATVTIDYKVTDGLLSTDASVSWTVTGTADAPAVSGAVTSAATEDGAVSTLDALANASLVDDGGTLSVTGVPATLPAGVTYDAGTHSFTLDPSNVAYSSLGLGDTTTVIVSYTVTDGTNDTPASVSWTVSGAADAPIVTGAVTDAATEDGAISTLDALANASVVDDGGTLSVTGVPAVLPDGVTYDALTHSFTLDPSNAAYQHLAPGASTTVQVDYTVTDGTSDTPTSVIWTVSGADDAPTVTGTVTGSATEDGVVSTLDALANATAVDDGETLSVTGVPGTLPAGVTYDALTHSFTLDPTDAAYQHLADGATTTVTVDYQVTDGLLSTPASVSWTVTGTDDAPSVSGAVTGSATDGGAVSTLDALANATAVDDGDVLSVTGLPGTLPPGVTYDALTHSFSLDPLNAAYQSLALGDSATVTVDYTVSDGTNDTPASVSWTVSGADDAPVVTGAVTGSATEDGAVSTLDALANASAVDAGETLSVTDVPGTLPPGVTYDVLTHSFSLDPSNTAYQHLADGATTTVTVDYQVTDGLLSTPASVSWTVEGTDDAPAVSGAVTGSATDHGAVSTLDALANASAVDDGDTLSVTGVPGTLPAGVTYDALTHSFSLDPSDAAYQHLALGDSTTVTIDYTVSDGTNDTPASVSWTVSGADDAPVVSGTVTGSATEDSVVSTLDALANATAVDDGDTLSVTGLPGTLPPGVTYDPDTHSFTLDPTNAAYAYLSLDDSTTVTVDYEVTDGLLSTPASVSWTVSGTLNGTVAASALNALDVAHAEVIDASRVTTVTGALADVSTAFSSSGISGLGGAAAVLSDSTLAVLDLNALDGMTTGIIDASSATLLTGNLGDVVTTLTSSGISGLGDEAVALTNPSMSAARLNGLDLLTSGTIDASSLTSVVGAVSDIKAAYASSGLSGLGDEVLNVQDRTVAATDLNALNDLTTGTVNMGAVQTVTGAVADLALAYSASGLSGRGNEALTLSDTTAAATDLNALNAATTGMVNMASVQTVTGALADLSVTYSAAGISGRGDEAITLSSTTAVASVLNTLDSKTTGVIDASAVTLVTGTLADVVAAFVSAGISGLGDEAVTLSSAKMSAAELNALDLLTSGAIDASSATSVLGTIVDVSAAYASSGITGLGDETVTLSDITAAATDLNALNSATTGTLIMSSVQTITGALADLSVVYTAAGISGRGNEAITLSDTAANAASLMSLDTKTTGMIDASSVTLLTGTLSAVTAAHASDGISGLGNEGVTLSDASVSAAGLNALDLQTTGLIDASSATGLRGTVTDLNTAYMSSGITGLGDEGMTLSDTTASATDLNGLNDLTTGTVNMTSVLTVTGALADLNVAYTAAGISGRGNEAVTLSDTTATATSLSLLDSKTTGVIDASSLTLLTGTLSAIAKVGASAGISGLGNAAYDVTGTTAAETIVGTAHDDRLNGLTGNDTLIGGDGADTFVFSTALNSRSNVDKITDFNVAQGDVVELSSTIFAGLATDAGGLLSSDAFALNTATGAAPQIVYDSASGALYYDANGAAAGGATQFATLTSPTGVIDHHGFWVV